VYGSMPNVAYERCVKKTVIYLDKKQYGRVSFGSVFIVRIKSFAQSDYETLFRLFYRYSATGRKDCKKISNRANECR